MALHLVITSVAPFLSSVFVPATPPHPTAADFTDNLDKFMNELRRIVEIVKVPGWQTHVLEVLPLLRDAVLLLPHFQGLINITNALPNPVNTPDAEAIHAKIVLLGTLIDETLEQSRAQQASLLSLEGRLPLGFIHPRAYGKEWLDGLGGKVRDLGEAWGERAPAPIKEHSDAVFEKAVENIAATAELYK